MVAVAVITSAAGKNSTRSKFIFRITKTVILAAMVSRPGVADTVMEEGLVEVIGWKKQTQVEVLTFGTHSNKYFHLNSGPQCLFLLNSAATNHTTALIFGIFLLFLNFYSHS